jgi:class 3 adenylate cyclase/predicted ATPase/energy-coupling factor transporter ATP-binding protein EcfA2
MTFDEVLSQVQDLLQREKRVSYRGLKRRFALDDEYLEDLKEELIGAKQLATDEDGRFLVWRGDQRTTAAPSGLPSHQFPALSVEPRPAEAERRQLTVQFIDLVGSTTLSQQLDPEELRDVVRAYHETCAGAISHYGGHTAQHLGDGLLVYFGYPTAHEDDAQRAVRTGLEILLGLEQLNARLSPTLRARLPHPIQVRIGIHTGLVVVGEIGSSEKREILALGETPNIAARIQGIAAPDEVMMSAATYHLVEGLFNCEDRGQPALKGISIPLTLYRVMKAGEAQSRFQVVARKGLTSLVGREHEYGLLHERWERVKDGTGQIVLLSGEPGIGKSRLVEALKESVEHEGARCLELRCSPYAQSSALHPVIEHLHRVLQFRPEDAPEEKLRKLVGVAHALPLQPEALPLLAALLSLPHPAGYPSITLSPQKQKEKTHEVLVAWLCAEARQQAMTYAWEDLHWADPSTLEFLTLFLQQVPTTRLLAVLTYRPEFTPPWGSHSYLSQLTLSRLAQSHVEVMVEKVTGGKALPKEIVRQIASKTDGVPLFVEELTKMVVESDLVTEVNGHYELSGPLPPLAIPSTLQDSLMARLDRLATVREIAQVGATLGREFDYALLQAVSPLSQDRLQQGLRQLVEAELVYQSGLPPHARYLFKHALVQDMAYQSLLKSRRQQLHQQIAHVLEEKFAETTETQPELLAHHYTEAGLIAQAIPYWQRAGERAVQHSANIEAIGHFTKGLELLKTLPDTPERAQQELTLQIALGSPLMATKGYGAPEVQKTYTRARELGRQVGETPQLFPLLWGLWEFHGMTAQYKAARELAEQCLKLAQSSHDPVLLVEAHYALAGTLFPLGELATARGHYEDLIALYDPRQHSSYVSLYVHDPGVVGRCAEAFILWHLGYPDQALTRVHEALTLARELSHPYSLGLALAWGAPFLHQYRREGQAAQERAEAGITISHEQGFSLHITGTMLRGWALAEQGQAEEGIAQIRQGLEAYRVEYLCTFYLSLLAEACGKAGRVEDGLQALAEALAMVDRTGECVYAAELHRLKGQLTLQSQVPSPKSQVEKEAEQCFLKAIEIARQQSAKSWELRAVMSLSRLWQQQGKQKEAHEMLAAVYNWFTEGFDTKDLQEAKRLIEELS